jgi:hypothetical protein
MKARSFPLDKGLLKEITIYWPATAVTHRLKNGSRALEVIQPAGYLEPT